MITSGPTDQVLVGVLGNCTVRVGAAAEPLPLSIIQRRLVSRLALSYPRPVSQSRLIDTVWEGRPPQTARAALQNQVSRIRRMAGERVVRTGEDGYLLDAMVDADILRSAVGPAERRLSAGDPLTVFAEADRALELWSGEPYAELGDVLEVVVARRALEASRYAAQNLRLAAGLQLNRPAWALQEATALAGAAPHDEHRTGLLAVALQQNGRRGEALAAIAATRRTLRRDLGLQVGDELERVEQQILGADPAAPTGRPSTLVGRHRELARLIDELGRGGLVRLYGEAGSGRSRLLSEASRLLVGRGYRVVGLTCPEHPDTAVSVLLDVLDDLGLEAGRGGVVGGFVDAVRRQAALTPLVLLIDDARFAGPTALATLAAAALEPRVSVALVLEQLPAEDGDGGPVVRLGPIGETELAELIQARWAGAEPGGRPVEQRLISRLAAASGGNPLLAVILADEAVSAGEPGPGAGTAVPGPGTGPSRVVRSWLHGLSASQRSLLEVCAVAGDEVPVTVLAGLTDPETVVPGTLLQPRGAGLAFRHGAARDVIYQGLSQARRDELHHAVGLAAAAGGLAAAVVAHHLLEAAQLDLDAAAEAGLAAAEAAGRVGAHRDADRWLRRTGIATGPDHPAAGRIRIALGDAMRLAGDPDHLTFQLECAELAAAGSDDHELAAAMYALLQIGGASDFGGREAQIVELTESALARLGPGELAAPVSAAASLTWSMTGQAERSRQLFLAAERTASAADVRRQVLPFAYLGLGRISDLARRRELAAELVELAERADDPQALFEGLHLQFSVQLMTGDGAGLRAGLTRMTALTEQVGDVGRRWSLLYMSAAVAHLDDGAVRAEQFAHQAWQLLHPVSPARAMATLQAQLLPLRWSENRLLELREPLAQLVSGQPGVPAWHAAYALCLAAEPAPVRGHPRVIEHCRLALNLAENDFTWLAAHLVGGRAAAAAGDSATRRQFLRLLEPWQGSACWQGNCSYGPVDTVLALLYRSLGEDAAAASSAATAHELAKRLGARVFQRELVEAGLPDFPRTG